MLEKIKKYQYRAHLEQLRDVRVVGFLIFGVLVLLVSWSGVRVIETNYELQKQVSTIQQENQVAELENTNLKLQNQYYETDQYLELTARKQFGKGLPGEKLIIVPKAVALAHTIDTGPATAPTATKPKSQKSLYQRNLEAWRDFFIHRSSKNS